MLAGSFSHKHPLRHQNYAKLRITLVQQLLDDNPKRLVWGGSCRPLKTLMGDLHQEEQAGDPRRELPKMKSTKRTSGFCSKQVFSGLYWQLFNSFQNENLVKKAQVAWFDGLEAFDMEKPREFPREAFKGDISRLRHQSNVNLCVSHHHLQVCKRLQCYLFA